MSFETMVFPRHWPTPSPGHLRSAETGGEFGGPQELGPSFEPSRRRIRLSFPRNDPNDSRRIARESHGFLLHLNLPDRASPAYAGRWRTWSSVPVGRRVHGSNCDPARGGGRFGLSQDITMPADRTFLPEASG